MAQVRNNIISTDAYCSKYKGLHGEKTIVSVAYKYEKI